MSSTMNTREIRRPVWLNRIAWILLIAIGGWFLISVASRYFLFTEAVYERFWSVRWWVLGHVAGGSVALIIGPFQFWKRFRAKNLQLHRTMGKIYLMAILIGSICAFVMCATTALGISWQWALSLGSLGIAWVITAAMAYRMIRLGRIQQHKEWMIRSYVVTFAFVTFRILLIIGLVSGLGEFSDVAPAMGWASWAFPLFITEVALQWSKN